METEYSGPALRTRRNVQPAAKKATPPSKPKKPGHVSAGAIFKHQDKSAERFYANAAPRAKPNVPKITIQEPSDEKVRSLKSPSSPRSAQKDERKTPKKRSDMHPLAIEFRDTADSYRSHLYKSTTLKINKTLEDLLTSLYDSTLETVSSDAQGSQDEPLRLTVPAKFERAAQKVYQPISGFQIQLRRTNTNGEQVPLKSTLEKRMQDFEEHLAEQRDEIDGIMRNWEAVVGEIWKVGVQCLGEESMEALLFTNRATRELSSSPSKATVAESTLFVPEHASSPPLGRTRSKKRVTFEAPNVSDELPIASTATLAFLHGPSRLRGWQPVPGVPALPKQLVVDLGAQIKELGKKEVEEYRKAERDYQDHWQKKTAQVLSVFKD